MEEITQPVEIAGEPVWAAGTFDSQHLVRPTKDSGTVGHLRFRAAVALRNEFSIHGSLQTMKAKSIFGID
jgi:hypothetical protein